MTHLYSFLSRIGARTLGQAPKTRKADFPMGKSPYKWIMISAFILGRHKNQPRFKNGIVTLDEIRPFYEAVAGVVLPETKISDSNFVQPFWKLGAGQPKIWNLIPAVGASDAMIEAILNPKTHITSLPKLRRLISYAEFTTPDFELLSDRLAATAIVRFVAGEYLAKETTVIKYLELVSP